MLTAAILAGGQARRLNGVDKSALEVGMRPILSRQLAVLRPLASHIMIVAAAESQRRERPEPGVSVVVDRVPEAGALGGIYTALMEAPTEQVLVVACDMPFLTTRFLARLADLGSTVDIAVPRDARGRHPLCASYHRRVAPQLKARLDAGLLRVGDALHGLDVRDMGADELAVFDPEGVVLSNLNTDEDYRKAQTTASPGTAPLA